MSKSEHGPVRALTSAQQLIHTFESLLVQGDTYDHYQSAAVNLVNLGTGALDGSHVRIERAQAIDDPNDHVYSISNVTKKRPIIGAEQTVTDIYRTYATAVLKPVPTLPTRPGKEIVPELCMRLENTEIAQINRYYREQEWAVLYGKQGRVHKIAQKLGGFVESYLNATGKVYDPYSNHNKGN